MQQSRSTVIIGAGVAIALIGALVVFFYARSLRGNAGASTGSTVHAYVATATIPVGTAGGTAAAETRSADVPPSAKPSDAISSGSQISGLVALRTIETGEVLTASMFGSAGTPAQNTSGLVIPAGQNAVTVNVPIPQDVAGYVQPGAQVNLYMISHDSGINAVRLLLSNITVLATVVANTPAPAAGAAPAPATGNEYFTLSLTPSDSEKVIFAETFESVWFALVHSGDPAATTSGQVVGSLFR